MRAIEDIKISGRSCRNRYLTIAILLISIISSGLFWGGAVRAESVNSLNPLYETLPGRRFKEVKGWEKIRQPDLPLTRTKGVFIVRAKRRKTGVVIHESTPGYGGPVELLVVFDNQGKIARVNVFRHKETECHILSLSNGKFLEQFLGLALTDKIRLLVGLKAQQRGDILAMTGGTITSRAVTEAVAEAKIVFYKLYGSSLK